RDHPGDHRGARRRRTGPRCVDAGRAERRGERPHVRAHPGHRPDQPVPERAPATDREIRAPLAREPPRGDVGMKSRPVLLAIEILAPIALLIAWYIGSADSTNFYFPPLATILDRFVELWFGAGLTEHALPSLARM